MSGTETLESNHYRETDLPIYEYRSTGEGCPRCREPFQVIQGMREESLSRCPECDEPVERIFSSFSVKTNLLSNSNLKNQGFTKLERRDKGVYENVTGTD